MPKYQIILYSDVQLPDDEFLVYARLTVTPHYGFKVVSAQNLEGVREEVYTPELRPSEAPEYVKSWVNKNLGNEDLL